MKKIITMILFILMTFSLQAMEPDQTKTAPSSNKTLMAPQPGYGMVYIVREVGWHPDIQFDVYLENAVLKERIGYTHGGQYIYFQVPAGKHRVVSVGKNTKTITFEIKDGETLFIAQNEKVDKLDNSDQDILEILHAEAGQYILRHIVKGWIDER
jgi:hypothetical protein